MIPYIQLLRSHKPFSPLLPIRLSLLPSNTQHRGCAWLKHYNSSRKWPFLRNFQGAVKGRRLMLGQALQGTGTPPIPLFVTHFFHRPLLLSLHPHSAYNSVSHANKRFTNRITLNSMHIFIKFSLSLLKHRWHFEVLSRDCKVLWGQCSIDALIIPS